MKAGWQTRTFRDVLEKTQSVNPLLSPEVEFEYIDVSSVSNLTFRIEQTQRLKGKDAPSRAKRLVMTDDILFATVRPTLQRIAIVPKELNNQVCSTGYFVLRPKEYLDHRFMFYWLFTKTFMDEIEAFQKGASYPAINDAEVLAQTIAFPPLREQQRIVAILDEAFENIATAKANAEKNLQNARAIFESQMNLIFGRAWLRDPLVSLSDLASDITDGDHMPPPKSEFGIPFITISDISKDSHTIDFSNTFRVSEKYYERLKANRKPRKGDVLYTVTGSFGIPVLNQSNQPFCFQRHIGLIRPLLNTNSFWLYYLLMCPQILSQATAGATGTAQKTVSLKVLRNLRVPNTPQAQQKEDATIINKVFEETRRLESIYQRKIGALDELKKSLLHQAFNGDL